MIIDRQPQHTLCKLMAVNIIQMDFLLYFYAIVTYKSCRHNYHGLPAQLPWVASKIAGFAGIFYGC